MHTTTLNRLIEEIMKTCDYCKSTGYIRIYAQRVIGDTTPILVSIPCPQCFKGYWPEGTIHKMLRPEEGDTAIGR